MQPFTEKPMQPFTPIAPPLASPVRVPDGAAFVVTPSIKRSTAEETAREAILKRTLRPKDITEAYIAPAVSVYVPLWRIDMTAEGFHLGLRSVQRPSGGQGIMPTGGARHRDRVVLVMARRFLCFDPSAKIEIRTDQMIARSVCKLNPDDVIEADLPQNEAIAEAKSQVLREVEPASALYSKYEARVRSVALCHYPVWLVRYRYQGEALSDGASEECHVAVSARTGKVVSAKHPSRWRSVAGRVKGWFK